MLGVGVASCKPCSFNATKSHTPPLAASVALARPSSVVDWMEDGSQGHIKHGSEAPACAAVYILAIYRCYSLRCIIEEEQHRSKVFSLLTGMLSLRGRSIQVQMLAGWLI